jgi:hypothetical protein
MPPKAPLTASNASPRDSQSCLRGVPDARARRVAQQPVDGVRGLHVHRVTHEQRERPRGGGHAGHEHDQRAEQHQQQQHAALLPLGRATQRHLQRGGLAGARPLHFQRHPQHARPRGQVAQLQHAHPVEAHQHVAGRQRGARRRAVRPHLTDAQAAARRLLVRGRDAQLVERRFGALASLERLVQAAVGAQPQVELHSVDRASHVAP